MAINKYSVVELGNIGLGQAGSEYESGQSVIVPPSGQVIVAITATKGDVEVDTLTPSPSDGTLMGNTSTSAEYNGDAVRTISDGLTIYGRWSGFKMTSGDCIAYFG